MNARLLVQALDSRATPMVTAYDGDAGLDLHVLVDTLILPGESEDVRTGIAVAIPEGHYGRVIGRSSALRRRGLLVVEGVIDSGFRGELYSYAINTTDEPVLLEAGVSIAQLIVSPFTACEIVVAESLPESERGVLGFGSSGR